MANRRSKKELQAVRKKAIRDLKHKDKDYHQMYRDDEPSQLLLVPLRFLWSMCVATICLLIWVAVGWYALGVLGFFWVASSSFIWSVLVPLILVVIGWIYFF
jgi:hypothetical protein